MPFSSPLVQAFCNHPAGLCGKTESAQIIAQIPDTEKRLGLLAFGIVTNAPQTKSENWPALVDNSDHWLFTPSQAAYKTSPQIQEGLQQLHLKVPNHIARVWWQISRGVQGRTKGSWLALIEENHKDAAQLLAYLEGSRTTFPVLSGPVLSTRWLDLVHRVGGVNLTGWESLRVPLPAEFETQAHLFGITEVEVHPVVLRVLQVWKQACQKGQGIPCGLANCPR